MRTHEHAAGLGWRVGARVVDTIVFSWLVVFVMVEIDQRLLGGDPLGRRQARLIFDSSRSIALLLVLVVFYEVVPSMLWGATPGKAVLGLRTRLVDSVPGPLAVIGRAAILYLPMLFFAPAALVVFVVLLVSVVMAADGRGLHDRLLGTIVVSVAREEP